jgi:N6-adenosine-specific RNA methylase IME4/ParB-like chromosome segregation protein Spo0J
MPLRDLHPVAKLFPPMPTEEFDALVDDIRAHGVLQPILVKNGQILDGAHRYRACTLLGIVCPTTEWTGDGSLVDLVVSLNLKRRHLSESQRAMVAARIANMPQGARTDLASIEAMSQPEAADLLNVGRASVQRAREVLDHGAPELVAAVDAGDVSVSAAADVADLEPEEQRELVARGDEVEILRAAKEIRHRKQEQRRAERMKRVVELSRASVALDSLGRFPLLYADPPWQYEHLVSGSSEIENHYPTMELDAICKLPVPDVCLDDCMLFLWATSPKLEEALQVLRAWGFTYRTCLVWVKDKIGMGYYARQRHELLLIGARGEPLVPSPDCRLDSVIEAPRGEHSAKPEVVRERIERMYPALFGYYLELFQRSSREGWVGWGYEASAAA